MNHILIPYKYTNIFCITSLWMFIPIKYYYNNNSILFINLNFNLLFSLLHWYYYKHNSILHNLDKLFSINTFTIIYFAYNNNNLLFLLLLSFIFLYMGRYYMLLHNYNQHFICHIIFRYISFTICCYNLENYTLLLHFKYTIIYIFNIILLL